MVHLIVRSGSLKFRKLFVIVYGKLHVIRKYTSSGLPKNKSGSLKTGSEALLISKSIFPYFSKFFYDQMFYILLGDIFG